MNLYQRNLLTLLDYTEEEIAYLLDLASDLKEKKKNGIDTKVLKDKNIVLLFEKDSTRTRCAFEVAAYDLGMHATYLGPKWVKKKVLKILLESLEECMMA